MSAPVAAYPVPTDTPASADLRATAHQIGTAARAALLLFAAELALDTLPAGPWRDQAAGALALAEGMPAGKQVEPNEIINAMQSEYDEGPLVYAQLVPDGPQAQAWNAVGDALGYAAWFECQRQGRHLNAILEGYLSPDSIDFSVDPFVGVPDLDWAALGRATAWLREHASKASEGWGQPLRVGDLRRAAAGKAKVA